MKVQDWIGVVTDHYGGLKFFKDETTVLAMVKQVDAEIGAIRGQLKIQQDYPEIGFLIPQETLKLEEEMETLQLIQKEMTIWLIGQAMKEPTK